MKRSSDLLEGYSGANPFHESQARAGAERKILSEFYPTSAFWSLFNDQHEILLGTRGSGKTFLLRMMSYTLRQISPAAVSEVLDLRERGTSSGSALTYTGRPPARRDTRIASWSR